MFDGGGIDPSKQLKIHKVGADIDLTLGKDLKSEHFIGNSENLGFIAKVSIYLNRLNRYKV
jgi:hypothetical protein